MNLPNEKLAAIKQEALSDLAALVRKVDWFELAAFNKSYLSYRNNPWQKLVEAELPVWEMIIDLFLERRAEGCPGVLDIGTFFPYYPAVLKRFGFKTEVIEKVSLYSGGYKPVEAYLERLDIRLNDLDIIKDPIDHLPHGYDIFLCSVLEHLNGSPRLLIEKIRTLMSSESLLYIVVPNICNIKKVWGMLRGGSPLPDYEMYWHSAYPFEGHNREMTRDELSRLCNLSSLTIVDQGEFVLPLRDEIKSLKARFRNRLFQGIKNIFPRYADVVWVIARKTENQIFE